MIAKGRSLTAKMQAPIARTTAAGGGIAGFTAEALKFSQKCRGHTKTPTFCRNHQKARSSCNARLFLNAPASAGLENIHLPLGSERIVRWCQFFQPAFPASIFVRLALRQCSSRTWSGTEISWVCALASPNRVEKSRQATRGFTSCCFYFSLGEQFSEPVQRERKTSG